MVDVTTLNEGGVDALIRKIMNKMIMEEYGTKVSFLEFAVDWLDYEDGMDTFGTEGWERRFNV